MPTRYIDPTTDFGFERLFGREDSRDILKHFLYGILELPHPIKELTFLPGEQLPPAPEERVSIYDVYCTDESGQRFIVEMQRNRQLFLRLRSGQDFKERTLYYSTFPITQQVEKGPWNYELLPIYCLSLMNFRMDDDPRHLRRVQLMDVEARIAFYDKLTFVFVELPKFKQTPDQLVTLADKWVYLLQRLPELQDIPAELAQAPFTQVFAVAAEAALSPAERWAYQASLKEIWDEYVTVQTAKWEGRAAGQRETKHEIARSMLAEGMDVARVARLTSLPEQEVKALQ